MCMCVRLKKGVDYMPHGSNCIIHFFRMVARIFSYIILHVPTYLGKGGGPTFSDLDVFADRTVIQIRDMNSYKTARGSFSYCQIVYSVILYEFVLYNSYKKCMNWYKNHTVYEFVLYNLYNNCMNSFVWIRTKISEKRFASGLGFQPGTKMACNRRSVTPSTTPSPPLVPFIYIPYNKNTIRKSGLYGFIRVAYSQSHLIVKSIVFYDVSLPTIYFNIYKKGHRMS